MKQSLGYTKSRTEQFRRIRQEYKDRKTRFQKKPTTPLNLDSLNSPTSLGLLSNASTDISIELGGMSHLLPPAWVDEYEKAEEKIREIRDIYKQLQSDIAKRVKIQFGNHMELDRAIEKKNEKATQLLQDCDIVLSNIMRMGSSGETKNEKRIRKNVEKSLATQIQEVATLLRKQQKELLAKIKQFNETGASSELNVESADNEEEIYSEDLKEMMMSEDLARERNEDVNKLIDNINRLNHLFKQMNDIVIEQGTIVDRIDFNIEQSVETTTRAKKELFQAEKAMRSKCGDYCIKMLVILNIVFATLLIFKYSH